MVFQEGALAGKNIIVTGANAGIGRAASMQLALAGATVIMACRSFDKGEIVREVIQDMTGNDHVHVMTVDMASQESIHGFVEDYKRRFSGVDALINNAANFDIGVTVPSFTEEGNEVIFATNYLGPFLLTNLLLDSMKSLPAARVVNISSMGLIARPSLKIQFDDLTTCWERKFNPAYAYYHSKLALLMFTRELAHRLIGSGVTANAIRVPSVRVDVSRYPHLTPWQLRLYDIKQRFAIRRGKMAEAYVKIAAAPGYADANGLYFNEKCRTVRMPRATRVDADCVRLWDISTGLVGMGLPI